MGGRSLGHTGPWAMLGIWVFFPEQEQGFGQGVGEEGGQQNPTSIVNRDSGCSMEKREGYKEPRWEVTALVQQDLVM